MMDSPIVDANNNDNLIEVLCSSRELKTLEMCKTTQKDDFTGHCPFVKKKLYGTICKQH